MFALVLLASLLAAVSADNSTTGAAVECSRRFVNENGNSETETYHCPEFNDAPDQTQCCDKPTERCCIAPKATKFYELPVRTAILITAFAVFAAAAVTAILITCCCWEKCPLYMLCRAEAKPDYIAKPEDVAAMSLMPDDNADEAKMYEPGKTSSVYMRC